MNWFKRGMKLLFFTLVAIFALLNTYLMLSKNTFLYGAVAKTYLKGKDAPTIFDLEEFDSLPVENNPNAVLALPKHNVQIDLPKDILDTIKSAKTASLLVLKDERIVYEYYRADIAKDSLTNSFSIAKTIVSLLVGKAITAGIIQSLDEPILNYVVAYQTPARNHLTFRHLLSMSSGMHWQESGINPLSHNAKAYYGDDLTGMMLDLNFPRPSGKNFLYQSGSTQLVAWALLAAIQKHAEEKGLKTWAKSLSEYAQEEIWKHTGAAKPAFWQLDRPGGIEKAFCCFYATTEDFARLGHWTMQESRKSTPFADYIHLAQTADTTLWDAEFEEQNRRYGLAFWLTQYQGETIPYFSGNSGQYIILVPSKNVVIVRKGEQKIYPKKGKGNPIDVDFYVQHILTEIDAL